MSAPIAVRRAAAEANTARVVATLTALGWRELDVGACDPLRRRLHLPGQPDPHLEIRPMARIGVCRISTWASNGGARRVRTATAGSVEVGSESEIPRVLEWMASDRSEQWVSEHRMDLGIDAPPPPRAVTDSRPLTAALRLALEATGKVRWRRRDRGEVYDGADGYVLGELKGMDDGSSLFALPESRGKPPDSPLLDVGTGLHPWRIRVRTEAQIPEAVELILAVLASSHARRLEWAATKGRGRKLPAGLRRSGGVP